MTTDVTKSSPLVSTDDAAGSTLPLRPGRPATGIGALIERWALLAALIVLTLTCMAVFPEFRTAALFTTMINAQSLVLILALIATIVLRTGDFDLSVSQSMVASAAVSVVLSSAGVPLLVAVAVALLLGATVGLVNAVLVVHVGVDSFVATLGSFTALAGLASLVTDGRIIAGVPDVLVEVARARLAGLPAITWYALLLLAVLWYVYERTPLGRYMIVIGGNRSAARLAGVPVTAVRTGAYVTSGVLAAVAGVLFVGYFNSVDPNVGGQFLLQPFAAAFLGATAVTVGRFNAVGTVTALYLLTVGITALQLLGAQTWVSNVFYGLALMAAVTVAKLAGRRRGGKAAT